MDGVAEVRQLDDTTLQWVAVIGGVKREWRAVILERGTQREGRVGGHGRHYERGRRVLRAGRASADDREPAARVRTRGRGRDRRRQGRPGRTARAGGPRARSGVEGRQWRRGGGGEGDRGRGGRRGGGRGGGQSQV